jgi:tRNA-dihydrouridine synthase A
MRAVVDLPVTVKHRIGVDDLDRYEDMLNFVDVVSQAGSDRFTVHARKAWLQGLSPKQNRTIPPLRYDEVYRLKAERPEQVVEINGGVLSLDETAAHLERVDAVMIGRGVMSDPFLLAEADSRFFGAEDLGLSRHEVVQAMVPYAARAMERGARLHHVTRHLLGLFAGRPGARRWRQTLSDGAQRKGAGIDVLERALEALPAA